MKTKKNIKSILQSHHLMERFTKSKPSELPQMYKYFSYYSSMFFWDKIE